MPAHDRPHRHHQPINASGRSPGRPRIAADERAGRPGQLRSAGAAFAEGDAARTTNDIREALGSFQLAIVALLLVAALDVVVAWCLWIFFDRVRHAVAVLAAWCRGLYAAIFAVAISHLLAVARLLGDSQLREPADTRVTGEVLAEIQQFDKVWSLGLGLFGAHLLLIGWLAFTSGFVPRFIGVLCRLPG